LRNRNAVKRSLVARSAEAVPYGIFDTVKDVVNSMLETAVNIQEKVAEVTDRANAIIDDLQQMYDDFVESHDDQTPTDAFLEIMYKRLHDEIIALLDMVFEQIDAVFHKVADYVDEMIGDVWGSELIKNGINKVMETIYSKYTDLVVDALHKAIDLIDFIEHEDWDAFVDRLFESIEANLDAKLDEFGNKLKNRNAVKRSLVARSAEAVPFGMLDSVKDLAQGMLDAGIAIKEKIADMGNQVTDALTKVAEWYKEITADGKTVTGAILEELTEKIVDKVGSIIEKVFDDIADVMLSTAEYLDEMIRGIWGEAIIREKIAAFMDIVMKKYVAAVLDGLQKILDVLSFIERTDWDAVVDSVFEIMESCMHEKLDELSQKIKERLGVL